jgi:hypothetical protein
MYDDLISLFNIHLLILTCGLILASYIRILLGVKCFVCVGFRDQMKLGNSDKLRNAYKVLT